MLRIGQALTVGTASAPHFFSGVCTRYSARDALQRAFDEGEDGENRASLLTGRKIAHSFEAKATTDSTDFLDLSAGVKLAVTGITGGVTAVHRAIETWRLNQKKLLSCEAWQYPDMTDADGADAGTLTGFTPAASQTVLTPGNALKYSTEGLSHAVGVVHELVLEQVWQIVDDDLTPASTIAGATLHGYHRLIRLLLLATGAAPAEKSTLVITGAPGHAADHKIDTVTQTYSPVPGKKMYQIGAHWIPPYTA